MMPVTMSAIGEECIVRKILGNDAVRQHLAELGFVVGSTIRIVSKFGENVIIALKDSRIALDKNLAAKILIG